MNKQLYPKLALINISKNKKVFVPYILTGIGTIAMFYIMNFLAYNGNFLNIPAGYALLAILKYGTVFVGIFSVIFLLYTNSFLIKQRKKELGLFNILGMEKKHIAKVLFFESIYVTITSLLGGIFTGIVFSKFMFLLLKKILNFEAQLEHFISIKSIATTCLFFNIIYLLSLLNNFRHIHLSKPIELLKGGQVGEKEPKTKWILVLIGTVTLSAGYYIALTTESPLSAMSKFFLAVLLVVIGTYALFTAGTIALLKLLKKNKGYYYQTKHFISVSGLIYRMKQNAVGLASICILSTAVLIMLSTTFSLYIGMEDHLRNRYPRNITITAKNLSTEQIVTVENVIAEEAKNHNITMENPLYYRYLSTPIIKNGNSFTNYHIDSDSITEMGAIVFIPLDDYNRMQNEAVTLKDDEVLLYTFRGEKIEDTLNLFGKEFIIKDHIEHLPIDGEASVMLFESYFIIMPNEKTILDVFSFQEEYQEEVHHLSLFYGFDTEGTSDDEIALTHSIPERLKSINIDAKSESVADSKDDFYSLYGGLFFLGIFLGILFIMATVLIIYYKQISEGFDDRNRFDIMQKVGLSKDEIKKSIKSQVLLVFFLPLCTAVIHIAFAFKVITKLLALFNLTNIGLFLMCTIATILVFALFYTVVYLLTAREYYKIVSN